MSTLDDETESESYAAAGSLLRIGQDSESAKMLGRCG